MFAKRDTFVLRTSENPIITYALLYFFSISLGITILILALTQAHRGLELSDEGFHLILISDPWAYDSGATQFGFIYHPLYHLVHGSIPALRIANISLTFALSWGVSFLGLFRMASNIGNLYQLAALSFGLASVALTILTTWLPTPSYYWLALQSGLVLTIGLFSSQSDRRSSQYAGWVIVALGTWLAFMARPTSGLLLALFVLSYLYVNRKLGPRSVFVGGFSLLAFSALTVIYVDGTLEDWIERLYSGATQASLQDDRYTFLGLFRLDLFLPNQVDLTIAILLTIALLLVAKPRSTQVNSLAQVTFRQVVTLSALAALACLVPYVLSPYKVGFFYGTILLWLAFTYIYRFRGNLPSLTWDKFRNDYSLPLLLGLIPFALAFGSNVNYWNSSALAGFFWSLSAVVFVIGTTKATGPALPITTVFVIMSQVATLIGLVSAIESPFRQSSALRDQNTRTVIGEVPSTLSLSQGLSRYIMAGKKILSSAGFSPGGTILDLTGQSPGYIFALGAKSAALPWVVGGYPGSANLASEAFAKFECDSDKGFWLLVEARGPRSIETNILNLKGFELRRDFKSAGILFTPSGVGGHEGTRKQEIFKPNLASGRFAQLCSSAPK